MWKGCNKIYLWHRRGQSLWQISVKESDVLVNFMAYTACNSAKNWNPVEIEITNVATVSITN